MGLAVLTWGVPFVAASRTTTDSIARQKATLYATFGTISRYDMGVGYGAGPSGALVDDDVRRTWWVRSRIATAQRPTWLALDAAAGKLWTALPVTASLDDPIAASYTANRTAAFALFQHFYGLNRRVAHVSKVLYPKRPAFFPLLDSRVVALYRPTIAGLPTDRLLEVPFFWDAVRSDLLLQSNQVALITLRAWLSTQVPASPVYGDFLRLTDLRLFDIVACW